MPSPARPPEPSPAAAGAPRQASMPSRPCPAAKGHSHRPWRPTLTHASRRTSRRCRAASKVRMATRCGPRSTSAGARLGAFLALGSLLAASFKHAIPESAAAKNGALAATAAAVGLGLGLGACLSGEGGAERPGVCGPRNSLCREAWGVWAQEQLVPRGAGLGACLWGSSTGGSWQAPGKRPRLGPARADKRPPERPTDANGADHGVLGLV